MSVSPKSDSTLLNLILDHNGSKLKEERLCPKCGQWTREFKSYKKIVKSVFRRHASLRVYQRTMCTFCMREENRRLKASRRMNRNTTL